MGRDCCVTIAMLSWAFSTASPAAEVTVRLADRAGRPLADAVVFVSPPASTAARQASPRRSSIVQRNRVFEPYVTVIERGTAIEFPNEDTMLHHVYSFSPAKRFEIKLYKGTPPTPVVFDVPGVVVLGCNLHDWMLAYVVVVDTPYFAKSGPKGLARIAGVPAGNHDLMAWYPGMREPVRVRQLALAGDAPQTVEHQLEVTTRPRPAAPPLDPMRY
jgi:plastocyanin